MVVWYKKNKYALPTPYPSAKLTILDKCTFEAVNISDIEILSSKREHWSSPNIQLTWETARDRRNHQFKTIEYSDISISPIPLSHTHPSFETIIRHKT